MKLNVVAESKEEPGIPRTRGEVAAQEQIMVFGQNFATEGEPRAPATDTFPPATPSIALARNSTANSSV